MKKLILAGLVVTIGFAPALALAQTSGGGPSGRGTTGSGTDGTTMHPGTTVPGSGTTTTPTPSPYPGSGASDPSGTVRSRTSGTPSTITNKGECERAGGKWHDTDAKCGL